MRNARGLLGLAGPLLLLACGESPSPSEGDATNGGPQLEELSALGYAGADPDAERTRVGVLRHDRTRAGDEWLLFTDERSRVLLMDREGELRRSWEVPGHDQLELALPLEDGGLACLSVDQGVSRLAADGGLLWQVPLEAHHELVPLPDGAFLVATHGERPYHGRRVRFDRVVRLEPDGTTRVVFDCWERREELLALAPPSPLDAEPEADAPDAVYDRFHLNAIQVLPDTPLGARDPRFAPGGLLLCLRNADLVLVADPLDGRVRWSFGPGVLDRPHLPRLLPGGTLLVFDNGWHRERSRVLELDPVTGEPCAVLGEDRGPTFFTRTRGGAERLRSGHTLVCVSERGQVLELAPDGEVLWEWWNPVFLPGGRRRVYRVTPVPAGWPDGEPRRAGEPQQAR